MYVILFLVEITMKNILRLLVLLIVFEFSNLYGLDTLNIGIIKYKTKAKVLNTYKPFADYFSKKLNIPVSLDIVDSDELAYLLVNKKFDLGIFKPFAYLEAKTNYPEIEAFATNKLFGSNIYTGAIIVKNNSGINNLHHLKDKKFLFVKPTSTSGYRVPKSIFNEYDIDIDSHFVNYRFTGSHTKSINLLLSDSVDGIAVDTEDLKKFSDAEKSRLKFLKKYDMPMHAYVLSPSLEKNIKSKIKNMMYNAYKDPYSENIFDNQLGIEGWAKIDDEYYNPLRRYMRLVRIKPYAKISYDIAESAEETLMDRGDIIQLLKDNIDNEIIACNRFAAKIPEHENIDNFYNIKISISKIDKNFFYQIYLNKLRISTGKLKMDELINDFPSVTINAILNTMNIEAELLNSHDKWFITYGANDGINIHDYVFLLEENYEIKIDSITEFNTFFTYDEKFTEDKTVIVKYVKKGSETNYSGMGTNQQAKVSFWDNLDNVWGVIGLLVALITGVFGYVLLRYKHRRFKNILYKSNNLLMEFIEGKYRIDVRLDEHIEFINTALEKGYISENQFMILKNRIDDIQNIIENKNVKEELSNPTIKNEIQKILEDGKITEKEYTKLILLLSKYKN